MSRLSVPAAVALTAVIGFVGVGCSNGSGETGSSGGGRTTTSTTRDKAVKFSECMRQHGIKAFPDPDASGDLTLDGVANDSSVDPSTAAFDTALEACKDLQPSGFTGHTRNTAAQKAALKFAQCIRDHGVKDFPDPVADQPLVDTTRIPSSNVPGGMDVLNAAMAKCRDVGRDAMKGQK